MMWRGLSIFLFCIGANGLYESDRSVKLVQKTSRWTELKESKLPMLVEFFSSRCGHCQSFADEFSKAAHILEGVVPVYAVESPEISRMENIEGVPAVKFYADGVAETYEGPRTSEGVAKFVSSQLGQVVKNRLGEGTKSGSTKSTGKKSKRAEKHGNVIELTSGDFDETVMKDQENVWFVKFYAPWCGHCQQLAPTWEELGQKMAGKAKIGKVDATKEGGLAHRFGVQGFPTLILFPAGKKSTKNVVKYEQGRDIDGLSRFVLKHAQKALKPHQLLNNEMFESQCADGLCFVAILPHILDSSAKERFTYLKLLKQLIIKQSDIPIKYFWMEAGGSLELERALHLEFGWPAAIVVSKAKGFYATHRGAFTEPELLRFLEKVGTGRVKGDQLPSSLPPFPTTTKWNEKDAPKEEL